MAKLEPPTDTFAPPGCRPCRVTWRRLEQGQRDTPPWWTPRRGEAWNSKIDSRLIPENLLWNYFWWWGAAPAGKYVAYFWVTSFGKKLSAAARQSFEQSGLRKMRENISHTRRLGGPSKTCW